MSLRIKGKLHYLWRAVDQHGVMLDILLQAPGMPRQGSASSGACWPAWVLARLKAALPIPARLTPEFQASLREQNAGTAIPATCQVTWVTYMGDEGGIVRKLDLGPDVEKDAFTSITHLRFDPRLPLAREIAAYQKHRVKRLKRQHR